MPESPLVVRRREGRIDLLLGNVVLLSSAALETERAFGALAPPGAARVLVGGFGFGATARAALEAAPKAQILVAEKVDALLRFVQTGLTDASDLAALAAGVLADPRVSVLQEDVADVIARAPDDGAFDAILLDVDNGPEWASFRTNARLYAPAGLASAYRALVPGGRFAVWAGYPADAFLPRLRAAGFRPSQIPFRERGVVRARAYVGDRVA
jgi:spermidine synthase